MTCLLGDTPRPFHTAVAQRHLETEVAHCVGGVVSPLLANIALSVLDEHLHGPWTPGGSMSTSSRREGRRAKALPTWRVIRYADDFVVMVRGTRQDTLTLTEEITQVLAPMGLRLSTAKTQVVHLSDGFGFLGFRIQRKRKRGTSKSTSTPSSTNDLFGR